MTSGQATRTQSETIEEQGEGTAQGHDVNEPLGYFQVCLGFDRASALDHRSGPVWLIKGKAPPEHFGIKRVVGAFADGTVTVRDRDTQEQSRIPMAEVSAFLAEKLGL